MNLDSSTGANVQNKLVSSVMVGRDNNGKSVSGFDPASKGWEVLCKWRSLQLQVCWWLNFVEQPSVGVSTCKFDLG